MNGLDIATRVMRLIGSLASGEIPDAAESQDMLVILNDMLNAWAAMRLMVYTVNRTVFVPATLKQTYTLGIGGDFNAPRPPRIDRVSIISLNNQAQPLELPIDYLTDAQWQQVPVKNITSALPVQVYDDQAFPLRNLSYWPIPNAQVQMVVYSWTALNQFPDLVTQLDFPPGYAEAIKYNAAVRACPEFGMQLDPVVASLAVSSMATVKSINIPIIDLTCDPALVSPAGIYNYISDTAVRR